MKVAIGIDVGNYDTKTQNTVTASSYLKSQNKNLLAEETVFYAGSYYTVTDARDHQEQDKTKDNYCVIMSLFAIAKEIMWQLTEEYKKSHGGQTPAPIDLQKAIDKVDSVIIGVGVPAGHYSSLAVKTQKCYMDALGKGISFTYNDYSFNLKLEKPVVVYPQDFAAVAANPDIETSKQFDEYYIIGIGGGTTDIIYVKHNQVQTNLCRSLDKGTTVMYEYIAAALQRETGKAPNYSSIESVLLKRPNLIDEKRRDIIFASMREYINTLVNEMVHLGLALEDIPSIFVGGGALMMRSALEENALFVKEEFVDDVHVNAKYYASFAAA